MATPYSKMYMAAVPIDPTSAIPAAQPGAMPDNAAQPAAAAAQPAAATPPPAAAGFDMHHMAGDDSIFKHGLAIAENIERDMAKFGRTRRPASKDTCV